MEEPIDRTIEICPNCQKESQAEEKYCTQCGFPIKGTDIEKGKYLGQQVLKKGNLEDAGTKIKQAKNTLFIVSALTILGGIILYFRNQNNVLYDPSVLLIINGILAIIYLVLGFLAGKKPFAALFTGTAFYLTIILASAIIEPITIIQGILIKIIIIIFLVRGTYSSWKANLIKKELNS